MNPLAAVLGAAFGFTVIFGAAFLWAAHVGRLHRRAREATTRPRQGS